MTSYQFTRSQSSHEDCGPSVRRLTPRPPDPSATLMETELAVAFVQCVIHDTASQDRALWHTEPNVMFNGEDKSKLGTQQGLNRDSGAQRGADCGKKLDESSVIYRENKQLLSVPNYRYPDDLFGGASQFFSRVNSDVCLSAS